MASWQARSINLGIRAFIRRRNWGNENQLARRARRLFGTPAALSRFFTKGITITGVREGNVRGEWLEQTRSGSGVILYMHGGGYVSCSPASHRPITGAFARLTRMRVFSVDYRLAPENKFPAALDDAVAAYRWLLEVKGTAPVNLALGGDSAGGGLTLALLLKVRDLGLPMPACAVCFSPWTDLAGAGKSVIANEDSCAMFRSQNIYDFAAAYLGGHSQLDPLASPVYGDLSGLPPVMLHVGSTELLLDDSRRVHDEILKAGGQSTIHVFDGVAHGWQMLQGIVPEAKVSLQEAAHFITTHQLAIERLGDRAIGR